MKSRTYLEMANASLGAAKIILTMDDRLCANLAAYHVQLAIELGIKYVFEKHGREYPRTYIIETLISCAKEENINLRLSEYIIEHAEMLTAWEEKTRYNKNYLVERNKVERACKEVEDYLISIS